MRFGTILGVGLVGLVLMVGTAFGYQACGWDEIRACLLDGAGEEFIVPVPGAPSFTGDELTRVVEAADYVADSLTWTPDPEECGDQWTAADQIGSTGDCEEFAILLCSLMRFSIGVPANRVWVSVNLITQPGAGIVAAHAWVGYKLEKGGLVYIEPQIATFYRGRPQGMLNFNDAWVRGGGPYLAGPRK